MNLRLDARQRAMLQEMGITVWGGTPRAATPPVAAPRARAERVPDPAPARAAAPAQGSSAAARPTAVHATAALKLHAARALYPAADPAQTPAGLGAGWLIVAESPTSSDAPTGDAARLLDNMLRAMQLHRHPRVFLAALERPASGGAQADGDIPAALASMVATLRPAMLLVLGHVAARAALGRSEPLGRLRAGAHQIAGCPAVVTYDPAFLLRSQATKAAAWADLCRALATVRSAGSGATNA